MRASKLTVAAAVLASTLTTAWTGSAVAGTCTLCFPDPVTGEMVCFDNMCAHLKTWLDFPPDAQLRKPIGITSIARELQIAVGEPMPLPWILVSPSTQRQFIVDMKKGTMTEIVAGAQSR